MSADEKRFSMPGLKELVALRDSPLWLLLGLSVTAWAALYVVVSFPTLVELDLATFRQTWGVWIGILAGGFSILTVIRAISLGIAALSAHFQKCAVSRILRLVPLPETSFWHLAKQRNGNILTQVHLSCQLSNTTDSPVQIARVRLLQRRARTATSHISLPASGSPYHSGSHPVPARGTVVGNFDLMIHGGLARQGRHLRLSLGVIDQFGEEYKLRKLLIKTMDEKLRAPSLRERLNRCKTTGRKFLAWWGLVSAPPLPAQPIMPWGYEEGAAYLDAARAILHEEKRNYAARGRLHGKLGSLNIGLQSEPNAGWTKEGEVPQLLWSKDKATIIASDNLQRLLDLRNSLGQDEQVNLETFLLSQLQQPSEFADVAYFTFLALHRAGRTVDALKTAQICLKGDKVFGYSNILGTLSALFSHEYFHISKELYPAFLAILDGDDEPAFQLREKINLASLQT